jgi:hypothetical protein
MYRSGPWNNSPPLAGTRPKGPFSGVGRFYAGCHPLRKPACPSAGTPTTFQFRFGLKSGGARTRPLEHHRQAFPSGSQALRRTPRRSP